jgi:hypothetical protein
MFRILILIKKYLTSFLNSKLKIYQQFLGNYKGILALSILLHTQLKITFYRKNSESLLILPHIYTQFLELLRLYKINPKNLIKLF